MFFFLNTLRTLEAEHGITSKRSRANALTHLSSPKPGHTTGGSRRGARRDGRAGSGRTIRQQNCSPREQSFLAISKVSKTHRLNISPDPQIREILCTCRIQNPDLPWAGQVAASGRAAGRGRAGLGANRTVRPGNKGPPYFPRHRRNVASTSLQKHEQAKFHVNRRRNKMSG